MANTHSRFDPRFEFGDTHDAEPARVCDHSGCLAEGLYRAPKSASQLREYHWFCLDHVREYNKSWNFCAGLNEDQIEALIRSDTSWERATRPMHAWRAHEQRLRAAAQAAYADGEGRRAEAEYVRREKQREENTPEAKALRVLGLTPPVDYTRIKSRYIELVKLNHPDAHGGDKDAEERLKIINQALQTLKAACAA